MFHALSCQFIQLAGKCARSAGPPETQKSPRLAPRTLVDLVPGAGLEPARPFEQRILNPPCLPFHHPGKPELSVPFPTWVPSSHCPPNRQPCSLCSSQPSLSYPNDTVSAPWATPTRPMGRTLRDRHRVRQQVQQQRPESRPQRKGEICQDFLIPLSTGHDFVTKVKPSLSVAGRSFIWARDADPRRALARIHIPRPGITKTWHGISVGRPSVVGIGRRSL